MPRRKLLNVRSVLEQNVRMADSLHLFKDLPPLLADAIREQAFVSRAILKKHEHTRKDVRVNV